MRNMEIGHVKRAELYVVSCDGEPTGRGRLREPGWIEGRTVAIKYRSYARKFDLRSASPGNVISAANSGEKPMPAHKSTEDDELPLL